jgi:poly(A) polymerase
MNRLEPYWLNAPAVRRLLAALAAAGIEARFVGGCVRDALLGIVGGDIDLATPARPGVVSAALKAAKIKVVATGIAHGTVTAVIDQDRAGDGSEWPPPPRGQFEITTLRRDIETDGRHARVAFGAGWEEDAARRDFTINAIYLAPDGTIFDPQGGRADLAAHRVRFVGDPATRIAEDVLRILRYYRFEARFGGGEGDATARAACRAAIGQLASLSAERVWRELSQLLATAGPIRALNMMREDGALGALLPEATRIDRLERLLPLSDDPLLRLAALIEIDQAAAIALAERLRLSNAERNRLGGLATPRPLDPGGGARAHRLALYRLGRELYRDLAVLLAASGDITPARLKEFQHQAETWSPPIFPLGGDDVTALGIAPGPRVGRLLGAVRRWWEDSDFAADRAACLARLKTLASRP